MLHGLPEGHSARQAGRARLASLPQVTLPPRAAPHPPFCSFVCGETLYGLARALDGTPAPQLQAEAQALLLRVAQQQAATSARPGAAAAGKAGGAAAARTTKTA